MPCARLLPPRAKSKSANADILLRSGELRPELEKKLGNKPLTIDIFMIKYFSIR
jgi:hypothetical protein